MADSNIRDRADNPSLRDEPLYNIGVVSRMTGIPDATLRVWERRYGFPTAARTDGGHRIYSEHEVERLRWVKARVAEGMQAGKAVQALRRLEEEGRFPESPLAVPDAAPRRGADGSLSVFHERFTAALLAHDLDAASQVLGQVMALYSLEELILWVMRPTLVDIGQGWAEGTVSVATEHLASHYVRQRLQMWLATGPEPRHVRPTVLGCAPGEWHDTSLLMMGVLLRNRRWPMAYLGQSVPLSDLARFVADTQAPVVVMVAMGPDAAAALADWPSHMPAALETGRPVMTYGGRIFTTEPQWREKVPGVFLGETLLAGVDALERLLGEVTGVS
jgi:DNA-binding transcriptional MerR regulator